MTLRTCRPCTLAGYTQITGYHSACAACGGYFCAKHLAPATHACASAIAAQPLLRGSAAMRSLSSVTADQRLAFHVELYRDRTHACAFVAPINYAGDRLDELAVVARADGVEDALRAAYAALAAQGIATPPTRRGT